jgi:hypothetical protein
MPSSSRWNPSRRQREAQRANRSNTQTSEFLQVIEVQLQAVTAREATLRQQQRDTHRSRSRSLSPPRTQPPAYRSHSRDRSPRQNLLEHRYRTRSPRPPPPPESPAHLDLNPHEEVGRTARPSPEEESVIGWAAYSEERDRPTRPIPHNPFAADSYRSNYGTGTTDWRDNSELSTRQNRGGYRGNRRGRGAARGRGQHRGRGSGRSHFDRINL